MIRTFQFDPKTILEMRPEVEQPRPVLRDVQPRQPCTFVPDVTGRLYRRLQDVCTEDYQTFVPKITGRLYRRLLEVRTGDY